MLDALAPSPHAHASLPRRARDLQAVPSGLNRRGFTLNNFKAVNKAAVVHAAVTDVQRCFAATSLPLANTIACLTLLHRALANVVEAPSEEKFRRLNVDKLTAKMGAGAGPGLSLLQALGFELQKQEAPGPAEGGEVPLGPQYLMIGKSDAAQLQQLQHCCATLHHCINTLTKQQSSEAAALRAAAEQAELDRLSYVSQMAELWSLGCHDRRLNFQALRLADGDVALAIRKIQQMQDQPGKVRGKRM